MRNSSFTKEQLNSLGVSGKDLPQSMMQSSLFPPLISNKPIEIAKIASLDYKLVWKEDFRSRLFEIHSLSEKTSLADTYSLKVANALEKEHKRKIQFKFAYSQMPVELSIQNKRKESLKTKPKLCKRLKTNENVVQKLQLLEQKERLDDDEKSEKAAESDEEEKIDNEEIVEDPELDDETDYHNNYFDNGEGYFMDEDDALDHDGPIY